MCVRVLMKYLFGLLGEEKSQYHQVGKWQEKVDICVILVLFHEERRPAKNKQNSAISVTK